VADRATSKLAELRDRGLLRQMDPVKVVRPQQDVVMQAPVVGVLTSLKCVADRVEVSSSTVRGSPSVSIHHQQIVVPDKWDIPVLCKRSDECGQVGVCLLVYIMYIIDELFVSCLFCDVIDSCTGEAGEDGGLSEARLTEEAAA